MSHSHDMQLPRPMIVGAVLLVALSIVAAALGRITGVGRTELPPGIAVQERALHFEDHPGGGIAIYEAGTRRLVERIVPGEDGFVRGVLRGFARARRLAGVDRAPPFVLTRWADGRLSMHDPHTEHFVALEAFGPTNAAAFARLMPALDRPPPQAQGVPGRQMRAEHANTKQSDTASGRGGDHGHGPASS